MADFFEDVDTPHGGLKRVIYKKYLQAYVAKNLNSHLKSHVQLIDGFAGKGRYESEWKREIESYGSPLIIIMVVLQYLCNYIDRDIGQRRGTTWERCHGGAIGRINGHTTSENEGNLRLVGAREIQIHLVERKRIVLKALKSNIEKYLKAFFGSSVKFKIIPPANDETVIIKAENPNFPITITLHRKQFRLFKRPPLADSRTLTILDPYGYSGYTMQHVSGFLDETSEVLITFMSGIIRDGEKNQKTVEELFGIVSSTGDSDDILVRHIAKDISPEFYAESYIDHMKERTRVNHAQSFEVKGEKNDVKYHLIHFTNQKKAFDSMKETFNTCTQYEGEFMMSDYKVYEKGVQIMYGNAQNEQGLANTIFRHFHGQSVDLGEVKDYVTWHTTFVFRKKALKRLEKEPNPRITVADQSRSPRTRRSGTFPEWGRWKLTFRDEAWSCSSDC